MIVSSFIMITGLFDFYPEEDLCLLGWSRIFLQRSKHVCQVNYLFFFFFSFLSSIFAFCRRLRALLVFIPCVSHD